jgi:hypothetical protein
MARSTKGGEVYSMKFYLDRQEFNQELALHDDLATNTPNPLTRFLPKVGSTSHFLPLTI